MRLKYEMNFTQQMQLAFSIFKRAKRFMQVPQINSKKIKKLVIKQITFTIILLSFASLCKVKIVNLPVSIYLKIM